MTDWLNSGIASVAASALTASVSYLVHRRTVKLQVTEQSDRLEIHRDELTFELLEGARAEMTFARAEIETLRKEVGTLRDLERHVYHFQQSLDHIEAILTATNPEERATAERNARAFLNRMRRLNDARGTLANEVQRADSATTLKEMGIIHITEKDGVPEN